MPSSCLVCVFVECSFLHDCCVLHVMNTCVQWYYYYWLLYDLEKPTLYIGYYMHKYHMIVIVRPRITSYYTCAN